MWPKINWSNFVRQNIAKFKRKTLRLAWLDLIISPIKKAFEDLTAYRKLALYKINHTGQVIYLQKVLNDLFDPENREIIVTDGSFQYMPYLYTRIKKQPLMIYWRWDEEVNYREEDMVTSNGGVYSSLIDGNIGKYPPDQPTGWELISDDPFLMFRNEYLSGDDFVVVVPDGLVYNINRMKSTVNFYKPAGRKYRIDQL